MSPPSPHHTLTLCGEILHFHCQRAIYRAAAHTLIVADLHLGKEESFGRAGIAIPGGASQSDLQRLNTLVCETGAARLLVLGDFMHATPGHDEAWLGALSGFLDTLPGLVVQVVTGNHDRPAGQCRIDSRVQWLGARLVEGPFVFTHAPANDPEGHVLCGHLHPVYRLVAGTRNSLRSPVFWLRPDCTVLPAFGRFTGGHPVRLEPGDQLLLAGPEQVIPMPPVLASRSRRATHS